MINRIFFASFLLFLSHAVVAEHYSTFTNVEANNKNLDREEVISILAGGNINSVDAFLKNLALSKDEYKSQLLKNYVLKYGSQSIQGSSFKDPRAIMFSDDGQMVMTFNGHKDQLGGKRLEMMQWNGEKRAFEMFDVDFSKKPPKVSEINPAICLECHTNDPRPNIDPYFFWSGSYGSMDDELFEDFAMLRGVFGDDYLNVIDNLLDESNPDRVKNFGKKYEEKFKEINKKHKLYRGEIKELARRLSTGEAKGYVDYLKAKDTHPRYSLLLPMKFIKFKPMRQTPNLKLNYLMNSLNRERIQRKLLNEIKDTNPFRYAILGSLVCIKDKKYYLPENFDDSNLIQSFLPKDILAQAKLQPEDYIAVVKQSIIENEEFRLDRQKKHNR